MTAAQRAKRRLPKEIEQSPDLRADLEIYWDAFAALNTCRPAAFSGVLPIPWTAVAEYARLAEFDPEQASLLHEFCGRMDAAFMRFCREKNGGDES